MEEFAQNPQALFGLTVDGSDAPLGTVKEVWVDTATGVPVFVGVEESRLTGQTRAVPLVNAQVRDHTIVVTYSHGQFRMAPNFAGDVQLTPQMEQQIYDYYGIQRQAGVGTEATDQSTGSPFVSAFPAGMSGETAPPAAGVAGETAQPEDGAHQVNPASSAAPTSAGTTASEGAPLANFGLQGSLPGSGAEMPDDQASETLAGANSSNSGASRLRRITAPTSGAGVDAVDREPPFPTEPEDME